MKKSVLAVILMAVFLTSIVLLGGCTQTAPVPGIAWARSETLTYEIKNGEETIGTLTVTSERLEAGEYKVERLRSEPFSMSAGTRVTKTAVDTDGKEILYSQSLLNGFTSLASYKKVEFQDKAYEQKVYHEGKHFYYSQNGEEFRRIKAKSGYADNELLYNIIRCYDIGAGYSASYDVLLPQSGSLEKVAVSVSTSTTANFDLSYTDRNGTPATKAVNCLTAVFGKSDTPSGKPITVWYSPQDFQLLGSISTPNNKSLYLPVKIIENDLTYILTNAQAL